MRPDHVLRPVLSGFRRLDRNMGFKGVFDAVLKDRRISCEPSSIVAAYVGKQRNRLGSLRVLKAARPLSISGASESLRFASHKIDGI